MSVPVYNEYYHEYRKSYSKTGEKGIANTKYILSHMINDYNWSFAAVCGILGNGASESGLNPNRPSEAGYEVDGTTYPSADWFPTNTAHGVTRGRYAFGLLQWVPWWKTYEGTGTDPANGDGMGHPSLYYWFKNTWGGEDATASDDNPLGNLAAQLKYINDVPWGYYVYDRWKPSLYYDISFEEFKTLSNPVIAAKAWLLNFERPGGVSSSEATLETATSYANTRASNAQYFYDTYYDEFGTGGGGFPKWLLFKFKGRGIKW